MGNKEIKTEEKRGPAKGVSNNPNGRPVGAKNKVTEAMKARIVEFWNLSVKDMKKDLATLEPKDRLAFMIALTPFILPKAVHDETSKSSLLKIPIIGVTQEEVDELLNEDDDNYAEVIQLPQ